MHILSTPAGISFLWERLSSRDDRRRAALPQRSFVALPRADFRAHGSTGKQANGFAPEPEGVRRHGDAADCDFDGGRGRAGAERGHSGDRAVGPEPGLGVRRHPRRLQRPAALLPEIPYDMRRVVEKIVERERKGRLFSIVVVAEGAIPLGGGRSVTQAGAVGTVERLGGVGQKVSAEIEALTGKESRVVVLGHLLRGGGPTAHDRLISLRFGAAAVRALAEGRSGVMVALDPPVVKYVPLESGIRRMKTVPVDGDTVQTARDLGISFGD
jgi:6-phosphofructokinase 1